MMTWIGKYIYFVQIMIDKLKIACTMVTKVPFEIYFYDLLYH